MPTPQSKRQALAILKNLGGTFDEDFDTLDAPEGMVWADGVHGLKLNFVADHWCPPEDRKAMRDGVWRDALERMEFGVQPCTDSECDYCHD